MACEQDCIGQNIVHDSHQTMFCLIFYDVFKIMKRISPENEKKMVQHFHVPKLTSFYAKRCLTAYVYQNCVYFSHAIMNCFSQCLIESVYLRNVLFCNKQIRICCLGGGLGTEAIGIGKSIELILRKVRDNIIDFHITIVDKCDVLKSVVFKEVMNNTIERNAQLRWEVDFITEDVFELISDEAALAISRADCLTMTKFSSTVTGGYLGKKKVIPKKITDVLNLTKENALIFHYDSPEKTRGNYLRTLITKSTSFQQIYQHFGRHYLNIPDMSSVLHRRQIEKFVFQRVPPIVTGIWLRTTENGTTKIVAPINAYSLHYRKQISKKNMKERLYSEVTSVPSNLNKHVNYKISSHNCHSKDGNKTVCSSKNATANEKSYLSISSSASKREKNSFSSETNWIMTFQSNKLSKKMKRPRVWRKNVNLRLSKREPSGNDGPCTVKNVTFRVNMSTCSQLCFMNDIPPMYSTHKYPPKQKIYRKKSDKPLKVDIADLLKIYYLKQWNKKCFRPSTSRNYC